MLNIIYAVATLGLLGLCFGLLLAYASKIFAVETDERLPLVVEALPGANCGGCGYPGCSGYAAAVVKGEAPINACAAGGNACAAKIAEILGVKAEEVEPMMACVRCRGGANAKKKYEYMGISDCLAASKVASGPLECSYGCLGLGTCVQACPYDAIEIVNGVALVHADKCVGCKKCVAACPRHIIELIPRNADVRVACSSHEKGAALRQICNIGCIGCKLCEKACEFDAIHVQDNLASIDFSKCTHCGKCALACPRKLIINASEITSEVSQKMA